MNTFNLTNIINHILHIYHNKKNTYTFQVPSASNAKFEFEFPEVLDTLKDKEGTR